MPALQGLLPRGSCERGEAALIQVTMFGSFSLVCGDVRIDAKNSRAFKLWLLLAYLIYNRHRTVTRAELIDLLGDRERNDDPVGALKTTRMRARKLVAPLGELEGQELILSVPGGYAWNPEVETTLDVERFETLLQQAEETPDRTDVLYKALSLYTGPFLNRLSGEPWVAQANAYFQSQFVSAVEAAVPLLIQEERCSEAADLCRTALESAPFQESLYRLLMESLVAGGDAAGAIQVYKDLRERFLSELGILPEEDTDKIYQDAVRRTQDTSMSMAEIRTRLRENMTPKGAMMCDFSTFQLFYQVEARSADRRGDAVHVGVLTLRGRSGPLTEKNVSRLMDQLGEQIRSTLRIGDVAAACSACQYVLLLVQANYENSLMVCQRVEQAFRRAHPRSPALVEISILPLEPGTENP